MHSQTQLDGTPRPLRVRNGRRGPHPKPDELRPTRTARVPVYEWDEDALDVLKAANRGKSEAAIVRELIQAAAKAVRAADAAEARQEKLPV